MKKFLIIGTLNAITYKDVFPSIMDCEVWVGEHHINTFISDGSIEKFGNIYWYTNIGKNNRKPLNLTENYSPEKYPKYDNYNAIEVSKVKDIPLDYDEVMGVPITFIDKYCPEQFEIIGVFNNFRCIYPGAIYGEPVYLNAKDHSWMGPVVNGKAKYPRILIKRR